MGVDLVECLVIGAGVLGLAVARALARAGREVIVVESEGAIGSGISSRNSEVIHAGIYYPTGLDKTRLCVDGKAMLYAFCQEFNVPHRRCGKLLVAAGAAEIEKLAAIKSVITNPRAPYDVLSCLEPQFPASFVNNPALQLYNSLKP